MSGIKASMNGALDTIIPWVQKVTAQSKPADSKYFTTTKKGEISELKAELNSERREKKTEAVKKVIACMTVGKDVSSLFADVINCMQTDNLELKKLVYLYLMNYAKTQPDTAIMAVNTFVKDCDDPNPLIRALAVRTMGCIRVEKITAYLCDPLRKCLKDEDPYVRKTAAVCVAKLYDIDTELVEDSGFLELLKDLLSDSNPMVVANAVAAISEILEITTSDTARQLLRLDRQVVNKLLAALNECTEWGQVFILDAVADYTPADDREAQSIIERVTPRLAHANAAVVLSTIKVIMKMLELIDPKSEIVSTITRKMAPPLVTLLSAEPEIQYVALRNISLIVQKRQDILKQELRVFFVKYNDPIYVKLEKLDIMIRLINPQNMEQVLAELKEYAKEVDVDFVRKAVRAIGRCAIKIESAAEPCVKALIELIETKVNYVVQEAIVVIKDIFRKYPNTYESIISILCENLDTLDEPEARASMIWIIGEYAERIDNADKLLGSFLDGFQDENPQVQLQLLTAIVKLFLKRPSDTQELVQAVLGLATQESDNPDLRDRGYIYWRLLSTDPAAAKEVVLAEKPLISAETDMLEPTLLDELICHLASLASVYHRPPSSFVEGRHIARRQLPARTDVAGSDAGRHDDQPTASTIIPTQDSLIGDLLDMNLSGQSMTYSAAVTAQYASETTRPAIPDLLGDGLEDLLSIGDSCDTNQPVVSHTSTTNNAPMSGPVPSTMDTLADIFGTMDPLSGLTSTTTGYEPPMTVWLPSNRGKGLEIQGTFANQQDTVVMKLIFTNRSLSPMTGFAIQFNKNSFGLAPSQPLQIAAPLLPQQTVNVTLPLHTKGSMFKCNPLMLLQIAVRNNVDVFYFTADVPLHVLFVKFECNKSSFLSTWNELPAENESQFPVNSNRLSSNECSEKLNRNNIFTMSVHHVDGQDGLYLAMKTTNGIAVLAELKIQPGNPVCTLSLRSRITELYPYVHAAFNQILQS